MGLDHIKELLSGRRSSRLVLVVADLVCDLEVLVVSAVGLTGPTSAQDIRSNSSILPNSYALSRSTLKVYLIANSALLR